MVDVYITIDTECSMGGAWNDAGLRPVPPERAILGKVGTRFYGTPLIMDITEENGLRGTFFIEVLALPVVDQQQMADAYGDIARRGHDAELHVHPVYSFYRDVLQGKLRRDQLPQHMDWIGRLPPEKQVQLLLDGSNTFRQLVGKEPVAFRAGCFGASGSTLSALLQVGILYDSSFNRAYLGEACAIESRGTNAPWKADGVWEVPVTNFETGSGSLRGLKPLDVGAVSLIEMQRVLHEAARVGLSPVVILLHSFTLFKTRDAQFRDLRPDRLVIRRFRGLCRFLRENSKNFRVVTFADQPQFSPDSLRDYIPKMGSILPLCRKLVQGINRAYWI